MGYHIFTARKISLTTLINNNEAKMMNLWVQQTGLMNELDGLYARAIAGDDDGLQDEINKLKNEEDLLERQIQLCETKQEELTNELQKVEEREKTAIDNDIPNYSGAGGNR